MRLSARGKVFALAASLVLIGQGCLGGGGVGTSGPAGIFVSTNKGEEWQQISFVPTVEGVRNYSNASIFRLVDDPHDPRTVYWLTRESGMLYSYDDGKTWRTGAEPLNSGFVFDLVVHPQDMCTLFSTNGRQILQSTNCGRSWIEMYREGRPEVTVRSLSFDPFNSNDIFALEANGDLLKSEDSGQSWTTVRRFGAPSAKVMFDPHREGLMYVATTQIGLWRSFDRGLTWTSLADTLDEFTDGLEYRGFYVYPGNANQIYWISTYGILVSRNAGENWDSIGLITPPGGALIYGFAVNPKNDKEIYYTGTVGVESTFYLTNDGGNNWVTKRLPSGQIPTMLRVHPVNTDWIYVGFTIPPQ